MAVVTANVYVGPETKAGNIIKIVYIKELKCNISKQLLSGAAFFNFYINSTASIPSTSKCFKSTRFVATHKDNQ